MQGCQAQSETQGRDRGRRRRGRGHLFHLPQHSPPCPPFPCPPHLPLCPCSGTRRINGYRVLHTYSLPHYVIYTVDRLLIPPSVQLTKPQPPSLMVRDLADALPELSGTIAAALGTEEALREALVLLQTPLTVFFPSNQVR